MSKKNTMKLIIKKDSFCVDKLGYGTGIIFFSANGYLFPSDGWHDFVVVLLAYLAKMIVTLSTDKKKEVAVEFMEGPFKASFKLSSKNQCVVNFIEGEKLDGEKEIIHKTITVPFNLLRNEVISACIAIIKEKESKGIEFINDYTNLEGAYNSLLKCE